MYYTIHASELGNWELPYFEDFGLDIHRGGKVQLCWSRRFREWSLLLLYYKVKSSRQLKVQVSQLQLRSHYSGFVLPGRGRHWHRKCKLGRN